MIISTKKKIYKVISKKKKKWLYPQNFFYCSNSELIFSLELCVNDWKNTYFQVEENSHRKVKLFVLWDKIGEFRWEIFLNKLANELTVCFRLGDWNKGKADESTKIKALTSEHVYSGGRDAHHFRDIL